MRSLIKAVGVALALWTGWGTAWAADSPAAPGTPGASTPGVSPAADAAVAQVTAKHLVMLYRMETETAPNRLDPIIQATSAALQHEFLDRHFKLSQPSPDALAAMDHGPDVIVSFAPDAGLSMVYSVYNNLRPMGAPDMGIADIRITAQIFIGSSIVATEEGHGQLQTKTDAASATYGVRKAYEVAAKDAASDLADRLEAQLGRLTPADIAQMVSGDSATETSFTLVTPQGIAPPSGASAPGVTPSSAPTPSTMPPSAAVSPTPSTPGTDSGPDASPPSSAPPAADAPSAGGGPPIGKRWLLAVAVGDISKVVGIRGDNLPGPATDLKNIQTSLQSLGFEESTTVALLDQAATTAAVTQALQHFKQVVQPNDEFVFYISGHGLQMRWATAGRTLPVLYDTNANDSQVLDFARIAQLIGAIPARQIVMLIDTCHAGAATSSLDSVVITSKGAVARKSGGAPELGVMLRGVKATSGDMAVFSASRADESSIDRGPVIGGLFTSEFLKALKATDGSASLQEVYSNYVLPNVTGYCTRRGDCHQTPILGYDGGGNLIRIGVGTQGTRGVKAVSSSKAAASGKGAPPDKAVPPGKVGKPKPTPKPTQPT